MFCKNICTTSQKKNRYEKVSLIGGWGNCAKNIYQKLWKIDQFWANWSVQDLIINRCFKLSATPIKFDFRPNTVDFSQYLVIHFAQ